MAEVPTAAARAWSPRPPVPGRPVSLGDPVTDLSDFAVAYEDETYAFEPGSWGRFGRDDALCEIPVWEELLADRLSRVAGELWSAQGQMWVRNLSSSHELGVFADGGSPVWLPARKEGERGRACSVPTPGSIRAPISGDWTISVRVLGQGGASEGDSAPGSSTARLGPVPQEHQDVARALCRPLMEVGDSPATYEEVAVALDMTGRQARRAVGRLCEHYTGFLVAHPSNDGHSGYEHLARVLVRRGLVPPATVHD